MSMLVSAWTFLFKLRNVKMSNSSCVFYRKSNHNTALEQIGMVSFTLHLSSTFNFSLSYAAFNHPLCRTTSLRRKLHSCWVIGSEVIFQMISVGKNPMIHTIDPAFGRNIPTVESNGPSDSFSLKLNSPSVCNGLSV